MKEIKTGGSESIKKLLKKPIEMLKKKSTKTVFLEQRKFYSAAEKK